jgi:hypothetical protein
MRLGNRTLRTVPSFGVLLLAPGCERLASRASDDRNGRTPSVPIDHALTSASPRPRSRQRGAHACSWCSSRASAPGSATETLASTRKELPLTRQAAAARRYSYTAQRISTRVVSPVVPSPRGYATRLTRGKGPIWRTEDLRAARRHDCVKSNCWGAVSRRTQRGVRCRVCTQPRWTERACAGNRVSNETLSSQSISRSACS